MDERRGISCASVRERPPPTLGRQALLQRVRDQPPKRHTNMMKPALKAGFVVTSPWHAAELAVAASSLLTFEGQ